MIRGVLSVVDDPLLRLDDRSIFAESHCGDAHQHIAQSGVTVILVRTPRKKSKRAVFVFQRGHGLARKRDAGEGIAKVPARCHLNRCAVPAGKHAHRS